MHRLNLAVPQWSSLSPTGLFFVAMLIWPAPLAAQPVAGKVQPDALTFGTVRVGATVEGSLRVFEDGNDTTGVAVKIKAPSFVRVKDQVLGTQTYGNLGTKIVCDISVSIDTSKSEDYVDNLDIQVGNQNVTVPVSVLVQPREAGLTRLLVVETPFQKFSTGDSSDFSAWLDLVKDAKLDVDYWLVDPKQSVLRDKDLSNFDVALVAS